MRLRQAVSLALLLAIPSLAFAQSAPTPAPGRPVRMVLASAKVPTVVAEPLHFRLIRVTLAAGQSATYTGPAGMLYVLSGAIVLERDRDRQPLSEGEATFIPAGVSAALSPARGAPAVVLHYLLVPGSALHAAHYTPAARASELHVTDAIPHLKPGPYEFSLTRVSVQPRVPAPPLHHRSGAALYYVQAGTWSLRTEDRREQRERGAMQFEPNGFVHTWEITGDAPGALLQANISPEGAPEIIFLQRP